MPRRSRNLNPHNSARNRVRAPEVVEAAMYLDELLASGHHLRLTIRVGTVEVSGETFCDVVGKVKARRMKA